MLRFEADLNFDFASDEYGALFACSDVTAFQHPIWQVVMQEHIKGLDGVSAVTLVMRCAETDQLVGVVPLVSRKFVGTHILEYANLNLVDYAMPVLHPDLFDWVPDASKVSQALDKALGRYDVLRIKHMPTANPSILRLFPNASMKKADFSCHRVPLASDFESWRNEAISPRERKSRNRKRRALEKQGEWAYRIVADRNDIDGILEKLRAYRKPRYEDREGTDQIQRADSFDFYRKLAHAGIGSGYVTVFVFTLDDEVVSVQYGLSHNKCFSMLMPGIDYDRIGRFSPGLLINEDMIRDRIEKGFEMFDFTVGDEPYKQKFGTISSPIYTLWHGHSMLGNMSMNMAELVRKRGLSAGLKRLIETS